MHDPAPFLARLKPRLGRDLIRLSMQDHYVEAVTASGSQLVLMRFADAISELGGIDGLRIHRSHWVATGGIADVARRGGHYDVARRGGRYVVIARDGAELPVSRTYLPALRRSGLIARHR